MGVCNTEEYIYDSSNGLWYELHGDYYIPCLILPDVEGRPVGIWGRKHLGYIKEHRSVLYADLVLSGKLHSYLADIDIQARNKLDLLVTQLAEKEGINEHLKERDQLAWVKAMINIRNRAEEIINKELIFVLFNISRAVVSCSVDSLFYSSAMPFSTSSQTILTT